jgi:hypothetical protein
MKKFKVYQIFLDGMTGYVTNNFEDFEQEIITDYLEIFEKDISKIELRDMMTKIAKLDVYEKIKFRNGYFEFYCFEMCEDEFKRLKEFGGW